jgi:hypothetical protein
MVWEKNSSHQSGDRALLLTVARHRLRIRLRMACSSSDHRVDYNLMNEMD